MLVLSCCRNIGRDFNLNPPSGVQIKETKGKFTPRPSILMKAEDAAQPEPSPPS